MINRKIITLAGFVGFFAFILLTPIAFAETVFIQEKIPFSKDSGATEAVKAECTLEERLSVFVKDAADGVTIERKTKLPQSGKILRMEIVDVLGSGGGAWSGHKSVTIKGTLTQNGKTVASFRGRRYSTGGAFGGYKGTCSILGRCIQTLGKDVALWLTNPTKDARLGDL